MGWNGAMAAERLKLVVQNRRHLLLVDRGAEPNLASAALAAACRVLPGQWREHFGCQPSLLNLARHKALATPFLPRPVTDTGGSKSAR